MSSPISSRLAVLIDADNAQPSIVEGLLAEVSKYGTASVKRIYGDWKPLKNRKGCSVDRVAGSRSSTA